MSRLESIYARLPIPLQNVACTVEGWRANRVRFGPGWDIAQAEVLARGNLSASDTRALRDDRLRVFLRHARDSVPYYRERWMRLQIDIDEIESLEDLHGLPILTKSDVQDAVGALVSQAIPAKKRVPVHTSGTTGGGLRFFVTRRAVQEQWATYWRYWDWHGITPEQLCAFFGGRSVVPARQDEPPFWRSAASQRRLLFSAHHMSPRNLSYYVDELRRSKPRWIHGYPSLISVLASYLLETGNDLGYPVRWVTTGAENLLPQQRVLIERAFGVRPRQHYGSTEAVAQFSECPLGALHVDEDFAAVEFVEDDNGRTRIMGTNLSNLATPLIRYEVGDLGTLSAEACACGRPGRVVSTLDGRQEDYVVTRRGARVAALNHIFKDMVRIREAQLVQSRPGEVTIRVVRADDYSAADENMLLGEAAKRLGDDMEIRVEHASQLPRTTTGKLRLVVSEIGSPEHMTHS